MGNFNLNYAQNQFEIRKLFATWWLIKAQIEETITEKEKALVTAKQHMTLLQELNDEIYSNMEDK